MSHMALRQIGIESDIAIDQSFRDLIDETAPFVDFEKKVVLTYFNFREFGAFVRATAKWTKARHYVQTYE